MLETEAELLERLRAGRLIEGLDSATEAYVEGLKRTLEWFAGRLRER